MADKKEKKGGKKMNKTPYETYKMRYSKNYGGECILLKPNQKPPNRGNNQMTCKHPREGICYIEWERTAPAKGIGHGLYCCLCGKIVQHG